jgi:hypothetical protein
VSTYHSSPPLHSTRHDSHETDADLHNPAYEVHHRRESRQRLNRDPSVRHGRHRAKPRVGKVLAHPGLLRASTGQHVVHHNMSARRHGGVRAQCHVLWGHVRHGAAPLRDVHQHVALRHLARRLTLWGWVVAPEPMYPFPSLIHPSQPCCLQKTPHTLSLHTGIANHYP